MTKPAPDARYDRAVMTAVPEFDIIVAGGAGMVGATLVCALEDAGLRIGIVDSQPLLQEDPVQAGFDVRVSAISPRSREIFDRIGVWDQIERQRICAYTDMHVWEADGTASIHFSAADIHVPELGYIIENRIIQTALHARLRKLPAVTILPPSRVRGLTKMVGVRPDLVAGCVMLDMDDGTHCSTRLLVGADGAQSRIREMGGFETHDKDYGHQAIVATVRTQNNHAQQAVQRFMDDGILAFLPLPGDGHDCSIVWSLVPEKAQDLMALSDEAFSQALGSAIELRLGMVTESGPRQRFPLRQRHAGSYVSPGVVLVGDAAHSIHPLAGLGANLGLQDAWALAGQILKGQAEQKDFASLQVLQRYQRERIGHNLAVMWLMQSFRTLFADQPLPLRWLRNAGMAQLDRMPALKHRIMRQAMGLSFPLERR